MNFGVAEVGFFPSDGNPAANQLCGTTAKRLQG